MKFEFGLKDLPDVHTIGSLIEGLVTLCGFKVALITK